MNNDCQLEIHLSASGTDAISLFFSGKADVAFMGITPFVLARSHGLPIVMLGPSQEFRTSHGVVVHKERESRIERIGSVYGSTGHYVGYVWKQTHSPSAMFVNLPPRVQLNGLKHGFLDGIACWEPYLTLAERGSAERVYVAEQLPHSFYNVLCATEHAVQTKWDQIVRFIEAYQEGVDALASGDADEQSEMLSPIFDKSLTDKEYLAIIRSAYHWQKIFYDSAPSEGDPIWEVLEQCHGFLVDTGLTQAHNAERLRHAFPENSCTTAKHDRLSVAYGDSMMSAAFHVARSIGAFERHGFTERHIAPRLADRVFRVAEPFQPSAKRIWMMLEESPGEAVTLMRRLLEQLLRQLPGAQENGLPNKGLAALIEGLLKQGCLTEEIVTRAHTVRMLGNIDVHAKDKGGGNGADAKRAALGFDALLDVLEWWTTTGQRVQLPTLCRNSACAIELDPDWKWCPSCGRPVNPAC